LITISGNDYSAVYSWVGTNSQWMGPANITDPLNNWVYEMHQYFDGQGGQTVCQPNWFPFPPKWCPCQSLGSS
jgi:hypothetical protein